MAQRNLQDIMEETRRRQQQQGAPAPQQQQRQQSAPADPGNMTSTMGSGMGPRRQARQARRLQARQLPLFSQAQMDNFQTRPRQGQAPGHPSKGQAPQAPQQASSGSAPVRVQGQGGPVQVGRPRRFVPRITPGQGVPAAESAKEGALQSAAQPPGPAGGADPSTRGVPVSIRPDGSVGRGTPFMGGPGGGPQMQAQPPVRPMPQPQPGPYTDPAAQEPAMAPAPAPAPAPQPGPLTEPMPYQQPAPMPAAVPGSYAEPAGMPQGSALMSQPYQQMILPGMPQMDPAEAARRKQLEEQMYQSPPIYAPQTNF